MREADGRAQDAIAHLCHGPTTIVIPHPLPTTTPSDRNRVLESGAVAESGRHDELLRKGGRYAAFFRLQIQHQEPREPIAAVASSG